MRGEGKSCGLAGSQPMSTAVYRSPNKLWRSNSIINLCAYPTMVLAKMTLADRTVKRSQVAKDVAPMHHEFDS
jgi:hypothetical protein